jgi:two-component system chemotaxis sensor kinase CheA
VEDLKDGEGFERDAETLQIFIEEAQEALERIEALLLSAEQGRAPADILAVLFRDIHTIKGTSGFLDLPIIERLSHAAEDLLAMLRADKAAATPKHFGLLLPVVDGLRTLVERVKQVDDEGQYEIGALVAQLQAAARELEPALPSSDAAPFAQVERRSVPEAQLAAAAEAPSKLGEILVEQQAITAAQLQDALDVQSTRRPANDNLPRAEADGTVRVSVGVLDRLMNLVGELVLARNQMVQIARTVCDAAPSAQRAAQRLSVVTSELQEQIMKTRMQPIARVFEKIPRMVRDLSSETGKPVRCQIDGNATEIDKALVEAVRDPVLHIIRNAIDHGIESPSRRVELGKAPEGQIKVRAYHEGGMVHIEIEDDGRGMDPRKMRELAIKKSLLTQAAAERLSDREALDLIFLAGFSTADRVSNISGRGVGMDVVRSHVERAGGQVELDTVVNKGTTVRLKMPLTLAIIPALLVRAEKQRFAIPQVNLLELVYLNDEQAPSAIEYVRGAAIYRLRGEILPLIRLSTVLRMPARSAAPTPGVNIVVVGVGTRRYGLIVDSIQDTEEIVIKPLHSQLKRLTCYSGATVLGDGGVALIVDVAGLGAMAHIDLSAKREVARDKEPAGVGSGPLSMLVFIAGRDTQCAVPLSMIARLEAINAQKIEQVAGQEVLQYRGAIIPVIRPQSLLPLGDVVAASEQQLVVFDFGRPIAMAVSRIVDVVDVAFDNNQVDDAVPYTVGKAVIFGRTTLLLDVYAIVRKLTPEFVREQRQSRAAPRVLVVDDSAAMRSAMASYLRTRAVDVTEVSSGAAALFEARRSGANRFDAIVTDLEMPGVDGFELIRTLRRELPKLPVLAWTFHDDPGIERRVLDAGAHACIHKLQREKLLLALIACGVVLNRAGADKGGELAA